MSEKTATVDPPARRKDSAPAIRWIKDVLARTPGASVRDFARAAGLSERTVVNLMGENPRPALYEATYTKIMDTRPVDVRIPRTKIIPGDVARQTIEGLRREGWSLVEIGQASGLSDRTLIEQNLGSIHAGTLSRILRASRLLRAGASTGEFAPKLAPGFVTLRQVEALRTQGWSMTEIAQRAKVSVQSFRGGEHSILRSTADEVRRIYLELRATRGPSRLAEVWSRNAGCAPWYTWTETSIKNARAVPDWSLVEDVAWRDSIRSRYLD